MVNEYKRMVLKNYYLVSKKFYSVNPICLHTACGAGVLLVQANVIVCIGMHILVTQQDQGILVYGTCTGEMSDLNCHGDPVYYRRADLN